MKTLMLASAFALVTTVGLGGYYPKGGPVEPTGLDDWSTATALATGVTSARSSVTALEARFRTWEWSVDIPVDASPRNPLVIIIR